MPMAVSVVVPVKAPVPILVSVLEAPYVVVPALPLHPSSQSLCAPVVPIVHPILVATSWPPIHHLLHHLPLLEPTLLVEVPLVLSI